MDVAVYYLMYLLSIPFAVNTKPYRKRKLIIPFFSIYFLFFLFIIGFRYKIGGDWGAYLNYYKLFSSLNFFRTSKLVNII
jgi:hypothetical protein